MMMLTALLKAAHIAGLTLWVGGLLVMPTMVRSRSRFLEGSEPMHEWHRFTRALFVGVISPAAFVAIGTGTALIFVRGLFIEWMFLKLATVGILVGVHVWTGHVILGAFRRGRVYPRWRQVTSTSATLAAASATLALVLAKPELGLDLIPDALKRPGGLQSLAPSIAPMP